MKKILLTIGISILGLSYAGAQFVTTWAGNGTPSSSLSGTNKNKASISHPFGIARDAKGNTWISTFDLTAPGLIILIDNNNLYHIRAGNTTTGGSPFSDGSGAGNNGLLQTAGLAVDKSGNIYFADYGNNAIRKLAAFVSIGSAQAVTTIAGGNGQRSTGSVGTGGYKEGKGDVDTTKGGPLFNGPMGIAIHPQTTGSYAGDVIVADQNNYVIRGVKSNGTTYLIAGQPGSSAHQDGPPVGTGLTDCHFTSPTGVWIDPSSYDIYVSEAGSQNVRIVPFDKATGKYDLKTKSIDLSAKLATGLTTSDIDDYNGFAITKANSSNGSNTFYIANASAVISNDLSGSGATNIIAGKPIFSKSTSGGDSSGYGDNLGGKKALFSGVNAILDISTGSAYRHLLVTDSGNNRVRDIDLAGKFTAIEENDPAASLSDQGEGFKLYPNPANEYFVIENKGLGKAATIGVYDLAGKVVSYYITDFTNSFTVPVNTLPKGIYIVKAQTDKEIFTAKVIVTK